MITFTTENISLSGSFLVLASTLTSRTGYRLSIPIPLLLLSTGMDFGNEGLSLTFNSPEGMRVVGVIVLSVILFLGRVDTKFKEIKPAIGPNVLFPTLGVTMTTVLTGGFIFALLQWAGMDIRLSSIVSMLLAATMPPADPTSAFNLLRIQRIGLKYRLRPMLELENGSSGPMAYTLTIALMNVVLSGGELSFTDLLSGMVEQFVLGSALDYGAGRLAVWLTNRINLPNLSLYPVLLLSMVFIAFIPTDMLSGNDCLTVYTAGLVVGNCRLSYRRGMTTFMEDLTWLLQTVLFLILGLLVNPSGLIGMSLLALAITVPTMLAVRLPSVYFCLLLYRNMPLKVGAFLSWVGLRGIVPIIFATYPLISGMEGADILFNVMFLIALSSLTIQGATISLSTKKLNLDMPEEKIGNEFGVKIPKELGPRLRKMTLTEAMFENGSLFSQMDVLQGTLVMMVKRGKTVLVSNGQLPLEGGDTLLCLSSADQRTQDVHKHSHW